MGEKQNLHSPHPRLATSTKLITPRGASSLAPGTQAVHWSKFDRGPFGTIYQNPQFTYSLASNPPPKLLITTLFLALFCFTNLQVCQEGARSIGHSPILQQDALQTKEKKTPRLFTNDLGQPSVARKGTEQCVCCANHVCEIHKPSHSPKLYVHTRAKTGNGLPCGRDLGSCWTEAGGRVFMVSSFIYSLY